MKPIIDPDLLALHMWREIKTRTLSTDYNVRGNSRETKKDLRCFACKSNANRKSL